MGPGGESRLNSPPTELSGTNSYQQALCSAQPTDDPVHQANRNSRALATALLTERVLRMGTSYVLRPYCYRCHGGRCVSRLTLSGTAPARHRSRWSVLMVGDR